MHRTEKLTQNTRLEAKQNVLLPELLTNVIILMLAHIKAQVDNGIDHTEQTAQLKVGGMLFYFKSSSSNEISSAI